MSKEKLEELQTAIYTMKGIVSDFPEEDLKKFDEIKSNVKKEQQKISDEYGELGELAIILAAYEFLLVSLTKQYHGN